MKFKLKRAMDQLFEAFHAFVVERRGSEQAVLAAIAAVREAAAGAPSVEVARRLMLQDAYLEQHELEELAETAHDQGHPALARAIAELDGFLRPEYGGIQSALYSGAPKAEIAAMLQAIVDDDSRTRDARTWALLHLGQLVPAGQLLEPAIRLIRLTYGSRDWRNALAVLDHLAHLTQELEDGEAVPVPSDDLDEELDFEGARSPH